VLPSWERLVRYAGVAPEEVHEHSDFEEALREIHVELQDLNAEAVELAATIEKNLELGLRARPAPTGATTKQLRSE
jgi:hypothetical protein